jgi:hypothetical protein
VELHRKKHRQKEMQVLVVLQILMDFTMKGVSALLKTLALKRCIALI